MNRMLKNLCCACGLALVASAPSLAQTIDTVRVASALPLPLFVTHAPGEPYYIYILQKAGVIRRMDLRTNVLTDFIDLNPVVINVSGVSDERGLLGLAFHPNYAANGYFYVYYTSNGGRQIVARYSRSSPGVGNPASAAILLDMADPFSNHNGGWMAFAPGDTQGYLYISTGDGGSGGDPNDAGQNLASLLGKMLRIDVDGADNIPANADDDGYPADATINTAIPATNPFVGGANTTDDLIWAYGLRNAWRSSFDRATGALYIGDVGQNNIEEINFQAANIAGGQNYGWRCYEGFNLFNNTGRCSPLPVNVTFPFHTYTHAVGFSVTGGYVYRGCAIPAVAGHYFYSDYGSARVWTRSGTSSNMAPTGAQVDRTADVSPPIGGGSVSALASYGEDAFGEIYLVRHSSASGEVFRIVPQGNPDQDCDNNNVADCGEIALGLAADCDNNGSIDSCQIASNPALDCDANNQIDSCQIAGDPSLDCNSNSILDTCEICLGDSDLDGDADFADIGITLSAFGVDYGLCLVGVGDADHDGDVDFTDISATLSVFGVACR